MGLIVELYPSAGPALVVGGGSVALRKARGLVEAGFAVDLVAPEVAPELRALTGVTIRERAFAASEVPGHAIVFACTDRREVNRAVGEVARAAGITVVVAGSRGRRHRLDAGRPSQRRTDDRGLDQRHLAPPRGGRA